MSKTTTVRVDRVTHQELKRLARQRKATVAETVARAVRVLRQEEIGRELARPLDEDEAAWLGAELG